MGAFDLIAAVPLVSIITPTRNQGPFIRQTLASVRNQTYPNIEHIVIDGASTDGTQAVLEQAAATSPLVWRSEADGGMYHALNKGLTLATGEIIAYLNSDDVYPPWAVEAAVAALLREPNADAVFGDGLAVDPAGRRQRLSLIPPFDRASLTRVGSLVQPAVFWRRRVHDTLGGFDADLRYVGDLDFWLRLGGNESLIRIDEVLAIERIHDAALSQSSRALMAVEEASVRRRHGAAGGPAAGVTAFRARARAAAWRRRLWLRFFAASQQAPSPNRSWNRFLADGAVDISPLRVALAQIPRLGAPFAWNAVRSRRHWLEEGLVDPHRDAGDG